MLTTAELESAAWRFRFSAVFALSFSEFFSKYSACASLWSRWRWEIKLLEFLPDNAVPHFSSVLPSRNWHTDLSVSVQYLKNSHTGLSFFRPASKVDRLLIFEKIRLLRSSFSNQSLVAKCRRRSQITKKFSSEMIGGTASGNTCHRTKTLKFQESQTWVRKIEHKNFYFFTISVRKLISVSILIFVLGVWFSF